MTHCTPIFAKKWNKKKFKFIFYKIAISNNQKCTAIPLLREPTAEELEAYIAATMQAASGYFGGAGLGVGDCGMEDIPEEDEDAEDGDYDPHYDTQQAVQDELEDQRDDAQLDTDKMDIEAAQKLEAAPRADIDEAAEEEIVNSAQFESDFNEAMQCVAMQSRQDKASILAMAKAAYIEDTGEEPTDDMLADALKMFSMDVPEVEDPVNDTDEAGDGGDGVDEDEDEDEEEVDPELFARELSSALDNIKKLGKAHQAEFVGKLSDTITELNGGPPSAEQISNIFGRIKEQLADEAKEDFLEVNDKGDDEEDSDYRPEVDQQQMQEDMKEDAQGDGNEDEDEVGGLERKKVKILVTPVKRRPSGSRVDIYLKTPPEEEDQTVEYLWGILSY